jgi:hypothetical protein
MSINASNAAPNSILKQKHTDECAKKKSALINTKSLKEKALGMRLSE